MLERVSQLRAFVQGLAAVILLILLRPKMAPVGRFCEGALGALFEVAEGGVGSSSRSMLEASQQAAP
jgi:hypothetical protein